MMAANCGMPAAEMTELLRKKRPKVQFRKIAHPDQADARGVLARPIAPACAAVPDQPCRRLRAAALLRHEFVRCDGAAFRLLKFVRTCDGGFNPACALLQARV